MKKIFALLTLFTIVSLFFATTQVLASQVETVKAKKTPVHTHTPGAMATKQAIQRATEGKGKPLGKRVNYKGTISSVDAASLTLTLEDGSFVTFGLTVETSIKIPTLGRSATVADLYPGAKASVHALQDETGWLTALKVLVIPGKPILAHRVGVVTDYQPGVSITIQAKDGNLYTFLLTAETKILPADRADQLVVGARVTIIAPRDVAGGTLTASGIVIHPASQSAATPTP
jgi:hypothetical protein